MSQTPKPKPQIERFKEVARAIGCDEDEATFKAKLAVIARQKKDEQPKHPKGNAND